MAGSGGSDACKYSGKTKGGSPRTMWRPGSARRRAANPNNDPVSVLYTQASHQTMDVLKVTPFDGGMSIQLIGNGRDASSTTLRGTVGGYCAIPDPQGEFTGGPTKYLVSAGARFIDRMWVCADSDADGDITDDDADYVATLAVGGNTWNGYGYGSDFEIVGKRIFRHASVGSLQFPGDAPASWRASSATLKAS